MQLRTSRNLPSNRHMAAPCPPAQPEEANPNRNLPRDVPPIIYNNGDQTLTYASQRVNCIPNGLWKMYPLTCRLDLSYNHINTMQYVEKFLLLTELILDNNCITERVNFPLLPRLKLLSLNNNRVNNLVEFVKRACVAFPNLLFLSLLRNNACPIMILVPECDDADYQLYRLFVLHYLPKLKYLDSTRVTTLERVEARRRGHLVYLRTPRELNEEERSATMESASTSRNIPITIKPRYTGEYLRTELLFTNTESEGNRFIVNNDL